MDTRRSCRRFLDKPVPKDKLEHIIKAVKNVPTGCNYMPLDIFVIQDKELLKKLNTLGKERIAGQFGDGINKLMDSICVDWDQTNPLTYNSNCVLVFIQNKKRKQVTVNEDAGVMAATAAYAAGEVQLKAVVVGMIKFVEEEILAAFKLSKEDWAVHLAVPVGEPSESYKSLPKEDVIQVHYL